MFKKGILWIHKWLGLFTGLIVFVLSISGAVYTFQDELKLYFYPEKYFYPKEDVTTERKPLTELIKIAQDYLPAGELVSRVDLYPAEGRAWVFRAVETNEEAFGYTNAFKYHKRVFLNPYSGKVLSVENTKYEFFQLVLQTHMNLLLGKRYGHPIVGYSTAIFALLLITGMVLWWPKKWKGKTLKRSLWLDRKAKWKRFNYDLHNVWGFYSFGMALVLCITGLMFSFPILKKGYTDFFNFLAQVEHMETAKAEKIGKIREMFSDPLDNAVYYVLHKYPDAGLMSVRLRNKESKQVDVQIRMKEGRSGLFKWYYINKEDLQIDTIKSSDSLKGGDLLAALNFDIHTGNIGGFSTKLFVFVIAMLCASLPITGYILWWNKNKKVKTSRVKSRRKN